jgi:hypothetical protein
MGPGLLCHHPTDFGEVYSGVGLSKCPCDHPMCGILHVGQNMCASAPAPIGAGLLCHHPTDLGEVYSGVSFS